jgi:hypothetical protein
VLLKKRQRVPLILGTICKGVKKFMSTKKKAPESVTAKELAPETGKAVALRETTTAVAKVSQAVELPAGLDPKDIKMPMLALKQSTGQARQGVNPGDIYRTTDNRVYGSEEKPVKIIPLAYTKRWKISNKMPRDQRYNWVRYEPFTAANADRQWYWKDDGYDYEAQLQYEWRYLLLDQVEKDAKVIKALEEGGDLPLDAEGILPFRSIFASRGVPAAQELAAGILDAARYRKNPYIWVYELSSKSESRNGNNYKVWTAKRVGTTPKELLSACEFWFSVATQAPVLDDAHDDEDIPVSASQSSSTLAQRARSEEPMEQNF